MKKVIKILIIISTILTGCNKNNNNTIKPEMCDCLYGYNKIKTDFILDEPDVIKKVPQKIMIPKGTSVFWYFCGKNMNFINWKKQLYLFKIGDMDFRIVVIGEDVYTVSEDDENLSRGIIKDNSIIAKWDKKQFYLIFKIGSKKDIKYFHELYFEDESEIGVIKYSNKEIKFIDLSSESIEYDYIKINKSDNTLTDIKNGKKKVIRKSDCKNN